MSETPDYTGSDEDTESDEDPAFRPDYADVRRDILTSVTTLRILGMPLQDAITLDGHTAILFCGIQAEGSCLRDYSSRVWHLPDACILRSGVAESASHQEAQLRWFDLLKDAIPVEERYIPLSLGNELSKLTAPQAVADDSGSSVFAVHVGETLLPETPTEAQPPTGTVARRRGPRRIQAQQGWLVGVVCDSLKKTGAGECQNVATRVNTSPPGEDPAGYHSNIATATDSDSAVEITIY